MPTRDIHDFWDVIPLDTARARCRAFVAGQHIEPALLRDAVTALNMVDETFTDDLDADRALKAAVLRDVDGGFNRI